MKMYDAVSSYDRMVKSLEQNPNWKAIVSDSVVSAVLKAVAEETAESVRYMEYLYRESKWDTAQNISSVAAAAGQLGYKPARKKSASGRVALSLDPRTHLLGRTLPLSWASSSGPTVPWAVPARTLQLNATAEVTDSQGRSYILASSSSLPAGQAFAEVTLVEGIQRAVTLPISTLRVISTRSKLDPYLYVPVKLPSCEDASTLLTRRFFKVFVNYANRREEYRVVDSLHFSTSSDVDVEVYPDLYDVDLLYLKFNTSKVRGKTLNLSTGTGVASVEVQYIESLGSEGNTDKAFGLYTVVLPNEGSLKLYGIGIEPLSGGKDEESVYDIKTSAPLHYMSTYTVATKESYENAIKLIDFGIGVYPSKVRVYAGEYTDAATRQRQMVTKVTMLLPHLEDVVSAEEKVHRYEQIERAINAHLGDLKAPVDILKYTPPELVTYAVGLECTADSTKVANLSELKESIRASVDKLYGTTSPSLDFGRAVYSADLISLVKKNHDALLSVKVEVEAVKQLDWAEAIRVRPYADEQNFHTVRLPFSFSSLFKGKNYIKGFKDYETGASYVMRIDILYRRASTSSLPGYHTSIFIKEDPTRDKKPFYLKRDFSGSMAIWPDDEVTGNYPMHNPNFYHKLENSYQFYLKKKIYSDDAFEKLTSESRLSAEQPITSYEQSPGALDSYLVWFNADIDDVPGRMGEGYFEFDIAPIYMTLQQCSSQDALLAEELINHPLATLQCSTVDTAMWESFTRKVLAEYVEIHVSMRPIDSDLVIQDTEEDSNVVLLIDSSDADLERTVLTNLTPVKQERFISVECALV